MKKSTFLKAAVISALFISFTPFIANSADHSHHKASKSPASSGALVEEMKALDAVFREVVSAVALGDGHRVHKALESMHGKMEKTQEALHAGEVKLKRNASKAAEFEKMDKDFHANLEMLAKAAHKGDRQNMTAVTKKLLDGCVACHNQFRP
jgi:cytochrome c556